jgi:DNA topoisomerase-1
METLKNRFYVTVEEKKFVPTDQGLITSDKLEEFFKEIINASYTAELEENLDAIANGEKVWYEELGLFYDKFTPLLEYANENMEKIPPKLLDELCPNCERQLVVRNGRFGEFVGCSGYPECKYIKKDEEEENNLEVLDIVCPKCQVGHFVQRMTKKGRFKGRLFYACNNYPKCKNIVINHPINELCPNCGQILSENDEQILCENKECHYNRPKEIQ